MKIDRGSFINDFIDKNLRQYCIPVYQRNYEWSSEQCEKLFEDIVEASKLDKYHFTGSVVYEFIMEENKIEYYVIIDGQQRLTTIYILLKALIDVADSDSEKEAILSLMFNQDKFKKYSIDESSKLKLKAIKSDNDQMTKLMENHIDQMDKSSGIYKNYNLFCELIKNALDKDENLSIEKIYEGIKNLTCASIKLEDEEKGKEQEIFERINSTGVPLSLADKIRNFVLMTDVDQDRLYEDYWLQIEETISKDQMSPFFLDYLNLKIDGFAKEKEAYDSFKQVFHKYNFTNESILKELLHYAKTYSIFLKGDKNLSEGVNEALDGLRKLKQSTVYQFLFRVFDDYEEGIIGINELEKTLKMLLSYSIRRLACEVGSNSLRGLYKTLYSRVFIDEKNKNHYYDAIVSFLKQLTSKDCIPSDESFAMALKEKNLYRKNALCKYLLVSIENRGKEKLDINSLTIEHIMPQNKKGTLSREWQEMLGNNWEYVHNHYLHTLGNLTLTGYNSELGDKSFNEKKDLLKEPEKTTHITVLNSDVLGQEKWNEEAMNNHAVRLSEIVLKLFPIVEPENAINFVDPNYKEYTVENPEEATFKIVNYYILDGERVKIDSFNTMVRSVALKLYEKDPSIIEKMAKNNEIFEDWGVPAFTYDVKLLRKPHELKKGMGIYLNAGFSARRCVRFICELLKKYDLDIEEDFLYSARVSKLANDEEE